MSSYILGLSVGLIFSIGLFFFIYAKYKKGGNLEYDERQMVGRGKAFQAGFYTTLIACFAVSILDYLEPFPNSALPWHVGALLLGIAVFAVTAIHFDAYFGFRSNPKRYYFMGLFFVVTMLSMGIPNVCSGDADKIAFGIMNLEVAVMWIVIPVALLLHQQSIKEEE